MVRWLDATEVAQAVQLLQDGMATRAVARRSAESPSTVSRAWRQEVPPGELDSAVEGPKTLSRIGIGI